MVLIDQEIKTYAEIPFSDIENPDFEDMLSRVKRGMYARLTVNGTEWKAKIEADEKTKVPVCVLRDDGNIAFVDGNGEATFDIFTDDKSLSLEGVSVDTAAIKFEVFIALEAGTYNIHYTATDSCGNKTSVTRTVTVSEPQEPYKTYVMSDNADYTYLVINATEDDLDTKYATYNILATYPAMGYGHNYEFDIHNVLWAEYSEKINVVTAENKIQPTKMDYWFVGMDLYAAPFSSDENLDLSNCTSMVGTFFDATLHHGLSFNNMWNVSNVTNMERMFALCKVEADYLYLDNWNVSNVTNMEGMFADCNVNTLGLANWNTSKVTNFMDMFRNMLNLKTIYAGEDFTIGDFVGDMFTGDTLLTGGAGTTYGVTDQTYAHIDGGEAYPGYFTNGGGDMIYGLWNGTQGGAARFFSDANGTTPVSNRYSAAVNGADKTNPISNGVLFPCPIGTYIQIIRDDGLISEVVIAGETLDTTIRPITLR